MASKKKKRERFFKRFILFVLILSLSGLAYLFYLWALSKDTSFIEYEEFGIPMPTRYAIHGIDVSHYQQRIQWKAVKKMEVAGIKIDFAFIKATEGLKRVDPHFKNNWRRSKEAGVTRGAYHFFIASKDGLKQAGNFLKAVKLERGDLPPVLDVEQTFGVSSAVLRKEVKIWLDAVENYYKVKPIIYTGADFYKRHLRGHFDDYPLWVAHYLQPHQPRISRNWSFWQHSERGKVNGILSKVDFNVFNGDSTQFHALLVP
ncbi:MAG: glycoside hydrolase family 25 protein [Bacteroidota bacterium]|nr:glycoside hydrolase family 25 protein [Bacteroidota bacterium]